VDLPHAERANPDGVRRTNGGKLTGRKAEIPSGSRKDREAKAGPAERQGEIITRRIGPPTRYGLTRKGADAILVNCPKDDVKSANPR
jgi:hypothetical protein